MRFVNLLQPLLDDVGVNLGSRNVRVAEHELDGPEVCAALEQVRGKTVPQHVMRKSDAHSGLPSISRKYLPDAEAAQRRSAPISDQRRSAGGFAERPRPALAELVFVCGALVRPHWRTACHVASVIA